METLETLIEEKHKLCWSGNRKHTLFNLLSTRTMKIHTPAYNAYNVSLIYARIRYKLAFYDRKLAFTPLFHTQSLCLKVSGFVFYFHFCGHIFFSKRRKED